MHWIIPNSDLDEVNAPAFAYVGRDGQIWIQDWEKNRRTLSLGAKEATWPRWSPDGQWILYFHEQDAGLLVSVCSVDGNEERVVGIFSEEIPIFAQWSPNGKQIVLLMQGIDLELWLCDIDELGTHQLVETGGPIFFSWEGFGESLLVHTMQKKGSRLIRHYVHDSAPEILSSKTGLFCVPLVVPQGILFVEKRHETAKICLLHGSDIDEIHSRRGFVSMCLSPDSRYCAFAGEEQKLEIFDVVQQRVLLSIDTHVQSMWWKNHSTELIFSKVAQNNASVQWFALHMDTGEVRLLHRFCPSQDQMFALHFFEQFGQVHNMLDANGKYLLFGTIEKKGLTIPQIHSFCFDSQRSEFQAEGRFASLRPYAF